MALVQLSLPVVVLLAFIVFKLNHEQKRWLFRLPIWISSTVLSLGIGHLASGVMGFYGAAFCDLLLYPAMLLVKKAWDRKENKLHNQKQGSGRLPFALPNKLKAVS
jgi:hypothetical protein